jgi:excinuclease ABC subunit C
VLIYSYVIILLMKSQELKNFDLPDAPGVYFFKHGKNILYVGKATSLKDRVKSYFSRDILLTRSPLIAKMLDEADKVEYMQTDSVLEALILEANQIKKHQPPANSRDKDDKSYNFVLITKEDFPRLLVERGKNLEHLDYKVSKVFGPFPHAGELREALKIVRRIFPYRDNKCKMNGRLCFNAQIGLCPGPCGGRISKTEYRKIIRHITLFFEGKKSDLIKSLEKEMKQFAKEHRFEEAEKVKRQLFALDHIQDIALIKKDLEKTGETVFRIEAYDIAHLSGQNAVGVMTVVEDGEVNKSQYRKFKIRLDKNDDTKNLKEVLSRRLNHPEWPMPSLIAIDGGVGQLNAAKSVLKERGLEIQIVSIVKDERHKAHEILGLGDQNLSRAIILANAEAHRFAIGYHRKLRGKGFRI